MAKIFEKIGMRKPRHSGFDLSREQKLSCNMGDLIPTFLEEVVPGDHFKVNTEIMMRLAPMLAPVMHRVNVYMHYFFVPNRIIWNQWEDFITGGREGTSEPTFPTFNVATGNAQVGTLRDYLGVPVGIASDPAILVSQLPFRAYQQIFNDYYRDQNLQAPVDITEINAATSIRKRAWEKDYFTSALPWTQRGPAVGIPMDLSYADISTVKQSTGALPTASALETTSAGALTSSAGVGSRIENLTSTAIDFTVNQLRLSSALQRWLETQARGGARYIETMLSQFGVKTDDARLQRAEYLGGGRQPIVISEVLNTTGTIDAPQGDMAGHGISSGNQANFNYKVPEHGYIMGIMSVLPKSAYSQGLPRHWTRNDKTDFYWPEFANLGEQDVKLSELYYDGAGETGATFGYQQRYAEYKYAQSTVHGDFRTTLEYWHMSRKFSSPPTLNTSFVTADPTKRIFAVEAGQKLWVQLYHNVKARRPMPFFADPRLS